MAKKFAPRVSKKNRKIIDIASKLDKDVFLKSDSKLLQGAKLGELKLGDIVVKDQVRTKFNDDSIKELAKNIEANGLIQPLVVHRVGRKYTLICGERRYRAMQSIPLEAAPCFILDEKNADELMAIQFSENSSREALHYIDKADGILNYQKVTKASERRIVEALGISKSEVHRGLIIAKLSKKIKTAAKLHNIEKYVLIELAALEKGPLAKDIEKLVVKGEVTKRSQLKSVLKAGSAKATKKGESSKKVTKKARRPAKLSNISANALLKAMDSTSKSLKMDKKTRDMLKSLVDQASEIVDTK
jgi:ParB family transcriptional regulator, chromosome partitioning protein